MRGVVYVDMLLFVNGVIGWCLLCCGARLAGLPRRPGRLLAGGALAGAASLVLLLPPLPWPVVWLLKLGSAVPAVLAAYPWAVVRAFFKGLFWYVFLNLVLCGVVFAALYYGGTAGVETNNLALYFHVSPVLLIGCVVAVYLAVELCALVFGAPQNEAVVEFSAVLAGRVVTGMALLDTGFHVRDPISGAPAFLLSVPGVRAQLPAALAKALDTYFARGTWQAADDVPPLRLLPVGTAAGQRALPAVRAHSVLLQGVGASAAPGLLAVFTPEVLADGSFCAIVNEKAWRQFQQGAGRTWECGCKHWRKGRGNFGKK